MSFFDLLLAEAIAAGLAREAAAREPPPDNFFVLPRDPRAWRMFLAASKKETMVAAIEITSNSAPNCRGVQPLFVDLARKFSNVPFLRVEIGLGATYNELRSDLGGVQYTPTILIVLFEEERKKIAKLEGVDEIRGAIRSGAAEAIITAFMKERVKLRMAERLAEKMALRLAVGMAMAGAGAAAARRRREEEMREKFEEEMERQVQLRTGASGGGKSSDSKQRSKEDDDDDDKGEDGSLERLLRQLRRQ